MKKRKKYNPIKSAEIAARFVLRGLVVRCYNGEAAQLLDAKTGKQIRVTERLDRVLRGLRHHWQYIIGAHEIESNGKQKTKLGFVPALEYPLFQTELVGAMNEAHQKLLTPRTTAAGWLAFPCEAAVTDDDEFIERHKWLLEFGEE